MKCGVGTIIRDDFVTWGREVAMVEIPRIGKWGCTIDLRSHDGPCQCTVIRTCQLKVHMGLTPCGHERESWGHDCLILVK